MARCVDRRCKIVAAESGEKSDEGRGFGGTERIAVSGHISSTLQDLADDLIFRHASSDGVQRRTAEATFSADGVTVAALLVLEDDGAFSFEWSSVVKISRGNGIAGPCIHDRTPWCVHTETSEYTEGDGDDGNHENGYGAARPVLFTFTGNEWKKQHCADNHDRSDEEDRGFKIRWKVGEDSKNPEEGEVGFRRCLDDGWIRLAGGAEGAEEEGTGNDGEHDCRSEDGVLPSGVRDEGYASFLGEGAVLLGVGGSTDDSAGHGPLVDTEAQNHPEMEADEHEEDARDDENVQSKESGKGGASDDGAAEHEINEPASDDGHAAED